MIDRNHPAVPRYRIRKESRTLYGSWPWRVEIIPESGKTRVRHVRSHEEALRTVDLNIRLYRAFAVIRETRARAVSSTKDDFALAGPAKGAA